MQHPLIKLGCGLLVLFGLSLLGWLTWQNQAAFIEIIGLGQTPVKTSIGILIAISSMAGGVLAYFGLWVTLHQQSSQLKHAEHQKEKAQVSAESKADMVHALENKVATLEKALEKALKSAKTEGKSA